MQINQGQRITARSQRTTATITDTNSNHNNNKHREVKPTARQYIQPMRTEQRLEGSWRQQRKVVQPQRQRERLNSQHHRRQWNKYNKRKKMGVNLRGFWLVYIHIM